WPAARERLATRTRSLGLPADVAAHLAFFYGRDANVVLEIAAEDARLGERILPDLPYLKAEVIFAVRHTMAQQLEDVLARRTRISIEDGARGTGVATAVARLMAGELGWPPEQVCAEVAAYAAAVERHLAAEGLALTEPTPELGA
ncbi:MAG TPA: glycerol-3-phosphate dehydrogenase C-terminal domain-containing protein, partial [Ktedonobacterales bacterium]|nr:glycerol-3-phosphate dehydrogenase C-terminal domain-containing protein [Ktedonobacterales bacterium]